MPRRAGAAADAAADSSTDSPSAAKRKEQPEQSPASATMQPPTEWRRTDGGPMVVDEEVRLPLGRTQAQAGEPTSLDFDAEITDGDGGDEMEDDAGGAGGEMDIN